MLRKRKINILTALLNMAAELRVGFAERYSWTFSPSFMDPEPYLKHSPGAIKHTTVEEVVDGPFFDEVIEKALESVEGAVGRLTEHSQRFQVLGGTVSKAKGDVDLNTSSREFFNGRDFQAMETRIRNAFVRNGYLTIDSVLEVSVDQLYSLRNFGHGCIVTFYRKLHLYGLLDQAKSWPPDPYVSGLIRSEFKHFWPDGELPE